jgi:hypothetical protein
MMNLSLHVIVVAALVLGVAVDARAQERPVLSPRDSVMLQMDTNRISVNYGRPSIRGRKIMGELVPWDKVWRTGANEATHLKTSFDMLIGGTPVTRGTYTLWTIPAAPPNDWTIIINRQTGQWGTLYNPGMDLARFHAKATSTPSAIDTFLITLEPTGKEAGLLKLQWESTCVLVPFEKSDRIRPLSPPDSTEITLQGTKIKVTYSKPFMRGRTIWGVVVPMDSIWRTGANSATALTLGGSVEIGGTVIPAGSYTLYSLPTEKQFWLIVSRKPGGGRAEYDKTQDLVRIPMTAETPAATIDPFTIQMIADGQNAAILRLGWSDRSFSTRITRR